MKFTLHIGSTKTGSSALQHHLFAGRDRLARHGVLYPDLGVQSGAHHLLAALAHPTAWGIHSDRLPAKRSERLHWLSAYVAEIRRRAEAEALAHVVLSSEYWWGCFDDWSYAALAEALAGNEVRLVCAVRRQDFWLESSYLQAVKNGNAQEFDEFMARLESRRHNGLNYLKVIERLEAALSPVETRVVPYEFRNRREYTARMIDLITATNCGGRMVRFGAKSVNRSPAPAAIRQLLEFNRSLPHASRREQNAAVIRKMSRQENTSDLLFFSEAQRRALLDAQAPVNRRLAQRFAPQGPELFFASLTAPEKA